jgi:hypothetical protein
VDTRAVSEEQMTAIGGVTRPLGEILTEVAEDRSSLIHLG